MLSVCSSFSTDRAGYWWRQPGLMSCRRSLQVLRERGSGLIGDLIPVRSSCELIIGAFEAACAQGQPQFTRDQVPPCYSYCPHGLVRQVVWGQSRDSLSLLPTHEWELGILWLLKTSWHCTHIYAHTLTHTHILSWWHHYQWDLSVSETDISELLILAC